MLQAIIAILLWSTLATLVTKLSGIPPFLLVSISLIIGGLCGLPWIKDWKLSLNELIIGVYGLFGYHFFLFLAFNNAPALEANVINYLWPLLIVLLTPLFFKSSKLGLKHLFSGAIGFLGTFLIVTKGKLNFSEEVLSGHIWAFIAALIWSTYSLLLKKIDSKSNHGIWPICLVSGGLSFLCHYFLESRHQFLTNEIPYLLILGLGPMGMAFVFWSYGLKKSDPRKIGAISYMTPILSTLLLSIFTDQNLTFISIIAISLVLVAAFIGSL